MGEDETNAAAQQPVHAPEEGADEHGNGCDREGRTSNLLHGGPVHPIVDLDPEIDGLLLEL